jgi:hypothetical protein
MKKMCTKTSILRHAVSSLALAAMVLLAPAVSWGQTTLFSEDFEGGSIPAGWTTEGNGSWSVATAVNSTHPSSAGNGTYCAQITHGNTGDATKLITPEIDLSGVASAELSFMHAHQSWSGDIDELKIYYRTSSTGTWTLLDGQDYPDAYATWTTETDIPLPNLSSTYQIAFEYVDHWGYGLGIDYVQIVPGPSCAMPTDVLASYNGDGTATATWNSDATDFNIDINGTVTNNVTSPYTFDVEAGTNYIVKVQANCGSDQSGWTIAPSFFTPCASVALPYSYGFEDASLLNCWDVIKTSSSTGILNAGTSNAAEGSYLFRFHYTENPNAYLVSPEFSGTEGGIVVTFQYKNYSSNYPEQFQVGYTTDLSTAAADFTYGDVITGGSDWQTYENTFPANTKRIAIKYNYTDAHYLYLDDFHFEAPSDCAKPGIITVSDVDGHNATITWTAGGSETSWNVYLNGTLVETVDATTYTFQNLDPETSFNASVTAVCGGSESNSRETSFTTGIACTAPTGVSLTAHSRSIDVSWTSTASNFVVAYKLSTDEEWTEVNTTASPYTIDGLTPEQPYNVKVKAVCGGIDGESQWSTVSNIHTDVACPAPTALAVNNIMARSADISWTGNDDATSYNLRYAAGPAVALSEDFENGLGQWTVIRNNDGNENLDWHIVNSNTIFNNEAIPAHSGDYVAMSRSWANSAYNVDNWLISPQVNLDGTLKYWVRDDGAYHEHYDIYVCTTSFDANAFDETAFTKIYEPGNASNVWTEVTVDLSAYAGQTGYVAFRNTDYDQNYLFIDDVTISTPIADDAWTTVNNVTSPYTIEGLTPEARYTVEVQTVYSEGESAWASATFTTLGLDAVPFNLQSSDVTANTATLSWRGVQESYNVRYRYALPIDPSAPATIILEAHDVWGDYDDSGYQMLIDADATAYGNEILESGSYYTASDYNTFEYLIPENAECSGTTENIVFDGSVTLQIPAGVYDWCIVNPDPSDASKIWFSSSSGDISSRNDNYVFEAGMTYHFTMHQIGNHDGIMIEITRPMSDWIEVDNIANTAYDITGLTPNSEYEWQVQGNLTEGTTEWSEPASFTTLPGMAIEANKWYAISSPFNTPAVTDVINLVSPTNDTEDPAYFAYDLFRYNEGIATWENVKDENNNFTTLDNGRGYIYRRSADAILAFDGTVNSGLVPVSITNTPAVGDLAGFNLVGNPYPHTYDLYRNCFTLGTDGVWTVHNGSYTLNIGQAVLIMKTSEDGDDYNFTEGDPGKKGGYAAPAIALTVAGNGFQDVAYARFANGEGMPKVSHLNEAAPMLSIPVESRRYAIANVGTDCQSFPVAFNGQAGEYTLTLNSQLSTLNYLHLIDRLTGRDIDMLQEKSYTFVATGNDADRFEVKLSPEAMESATGHFAYWNGKVWMVEGNGTLEAYDVTGRKLFSSEVNSQLSILNSQFPSTGVYVLRMGNKSQKIVIR